MLGPTKKSVVAIACAIGVVACAQIAGLEEPAGTVENAPPDPPPPGADGTLKTPEGVAITPAQLLLPAGACQEAREGSLTIANTGDKPATWEVKIPSQATFTLRNAKDGVVGGTLEPKASVFVYIDAKGTIPGPAAVDLIVKAGSTIQQLPVKLDVRGGLLSITPPIADFGDVRRDTQSAPILVELKNDGNEQVSVTAWEAFGAEFALTPNGSVNVPANGKATVEAVLKAGPAADMVHQATLKPTVGSPLCNEIPSSVLKGKRVNTEVTVTPITADFGDRYCSENPGSATITVSNYATGATATYAATLALGAASRFKITENASGTVGTAANATTPATKAIKVVPNNIAPPLGLIEENLDVDITDPPGAASKKTIKLRLVARGAILEVTPPSLTFGPDETKSIGLKNVGNTRVCVVYSDTTNNGFFIEDDIDSISGGGGTENINITFNATQAGTYNYTINIQPVPCFLIDAPTPFCTAVTKPTISGTR